MIDLRRLIRPDDAVTAAAWNAAEEYYAKAGLELGSLDRVVRDVWERELQIPCWVIDGVGGTRPTSTSQFSQAGASKEPTSPAAIVDFMNEVQHHVGGKLALGLHTGLYYDGADTPWDQLSPENFQVYFNAARAGGWGLGFHPTLFNHPFVSQGLDLATLSSLDEAKRRYFINHVLATIDVAADFSSLGSGKTLVNIWAIDGAKTKPIYREEKRVAFRRSLDEIAPLIPQELVDVAVEFKLTAPETEQFTAGSLEFLQGYVASHHPYLLTLDLGHSWPGHDWDDHVSSASADGIRLASHISRGAYSDADLTVVYSSSLQSYFDELRRCGLEDSWVGIDTFDKITDPFAAILISTMSIRAAQVIAEVNNLLAKSAYEAEKSGNEGLKMAIMGSGLLTPTLIWARASQIIDLPDPTDIFLRAV